VGSRLDTMRIDSSTTRAARDPNDPRNNVEKVIRFIPIIGLL